MVTNYTEFKMFLEKLNIRPKLLLHACCAPCSSYTLIFLMKYFDVTIFYSNDNIAPFEEYDRRLEEIKRFISNFDGVKLIYDEYRPQDYNEAVKGYEALGEKSLRCYKCYELRLSETAKIAEELGFDNFCTTLTLSPHKNSNWINEIGKELNDKYTSNYLYSDFKKKNGYKRSIELSSLYNLYRQNYCGCVYSIRDKKDE